jgi:dihydrofolate reductase
VATRPEEGIVKVIVFVGTSIDGFIAEANGGLDFLKPFEGEEHGYDDFFRSIDTLVVGRATYQTVLGFEAWPYKGKRVVVLTHRPLQPKYGETTHQGELAPLFIRLAAEGARHVYLDGGVAIRQGLRERLVDEMTISTVPITLGAGRPLFGGDVQTTAWRLVSFRQLPSGLVQARYARQAK